MSFLVTGGAGYIGAHVVRACQAAGLEVVVLDDLSSGRRSFVPADVPFVEASILDTPRLSETMSEHHVTVVIHLAGYKYASVSVQRPLFTYEHNVTGTARVLAAMRDAGVKGIVFSSSAAVYGTPAVDVVTEETATRPESPYGESKLVGEWLIRSAARAHGFRHTSLRYFNVVGSAAPTLHDTSPHNLFPVVIDALRSGKTPAINGDDYPTRDGTCVRDFIHVADLADAHVVAGRRLDAGDALEPVYNLGSGTGVTVREIMMAFADVTGRHFTPEVHPRRPGDPATVVANGDLAAAHLDWRMRHSIHDMVESAWAAVRAQKPESDQSGG
ncbi:MAG TPA: UDP-glucose 4-epimerase GalE [Aeromicrobium sp.]|nr:UDP-glucose 4-epimerase GalE [Aeromicrobium sp.]